MALSDPPQTHSTQSLPPTQTEEQKQAAVREARRAENLSVQKDGVYILLPWKRWIYDTENVIPRIHDNDYLWKPFYHLNAYQPPCPSVLRQDITEILKPREIVIQPPPPLAPIATAMSALQAADGWQDRGKRSRARTRPSAQQPADPTPEKATTTEDCTADPQKPLQDPMVPEMSALQALDGWQTKGRRTRQGMPSSSDLGQVTTTANSTDNTQEAIEELINPALAALEAVDGWQRQGRRSRPRTRLQVDQPSSSDVGQANTANDSTANAQEPTTDHILPAIAALKAVDGLRTKRRVSLPRTCSPIAQSSSSDLREVKTIEENNDKPERQGKTPIIEDIQPTQPPPTQPACHSADPLSQPTKDSVDQAIAALQAVDGWESSRRRSRRSQLRPSSNSDAGQAVAANHSGDKTFPERENPAVQVVDRTQSPPVTSQTVQPPSVQPTTVLSPSVQPLPVEPHPVKLPLVQPSPVIPLQKDPLIEAMAALEAMNDWQSRGKRSRPRMRSPVEQSSSLGLGKAVATDNHGDNSCGKTEDTTIQVVQSAQPAPVHLPVVQPLSIQSRPVQPPPVQLPLVESTLVKPFAVEPQPVLSLPVLSLPVVPPRVSSLVLKFHPVEPQPAQLEPVLPLRIQPPPVLYIPPVIPPRVTSLVIKPLPAEPTPVEHPSAPSPPAQPSNTAPPETTPSTKESTANGLPSFRRYCRFRIAKVLKSASKVADAVVDRIR